MADYSEPFARFILECSAAYRDIRERIENGEIPAGTSAELKIEIPPSVVDEIRMDCLAGIAEANGHG